MSKLDRIDRFEEESPIDVISVQNDFDGFKSDYPYDEDNIAYEDDNDSQYWYIWDTEDSIIENIDAWYNQFDQERIDELVKNEDYMWLDEYMESLPDGMKSEVRGYISNNYPEFLENTEYTEFEPMNSKKVTDSEKKRMIETMEKRHPSQSRVKKEISEAFLAESYKE